MTYSFTDAPFLSAMRIVGEIDKTTANPNVVVTWNANNVGPYKETQSTPGGTIVKTLLTELIVVISPTKAIKGGAEVFYLTSGAVVAGAIRQVQYTASKRGVLNSEKSSPPTSYSSTKYKKHNHNAYVFVFEASDVKSLGDKFDNAIETLNRQYELIQMGLNLRQRAFESDVQGQQDAFETSEAAARALFESGMESDFDAFVATQREITAVIKTGDNTLLNISSGNWLDSGTLRAYAGVNDYDPTDNRVNYLELVTSTGALQEATSGFTDGNYPIAKVTVSAAGVITEIVNVGAAYNIPAPPVIPSAPTFDTNKFTTATTWAARDGLSSTETDVIVLDASQMTGGELELQVDGVKHAAVLNGNNGSFVVEADDDVDVIAQALTWYLKGASYDSKSFDVASQNSSVGDIVFNDDGTKMYMSSITSSTVYQYTLSTAYDVSTASYDSKSLSMVSQISSGFLTGIAFSADGTKCYGTGQAGIDIFQYDLSTAWDLSTASYASKTLAVDSQDNQVQGIDFSLDGTKLYVIGDQTDAVYQYTLSTAWDLSTASYDSKSMSVSSEFTSPKGGRISSDGTKYYMCHGGGTGKVFEYSLSTAYDISTGSYSGISFTIGGEDSQVNGFCFSDDGAKMYTAGDTGNDIHQYSAGSSFAGTGRASIIY